MTTIKITKKNRHIMAVSCQGHTGYGDEGEDIVCAALSSIVQTALLGLMQVAAINAKCTIDAPNAILEVALPDMLNSDDRHNADIILDTMLLGVSDLYEQYARYIKLKIINN